MSLHNTIDEIIREIGTARHCRQVGNVLIQETGLVLDHQRDISSDLQAVLLKGRKYTELLDKILKKIGIATDISEVLINEESIVNQVNLRAEVANNYEELMKQYAQLENQLEVCKASLIACQEEHLEL